MLTKTLKALEKGLVRMKSNSKLILVAVLVFVFPAFFFWMTQGFFESAYSNINTAQKNQVSVMHDSLRALLENQGLNQVLINNLITTYSRQNQDLAKIRVVEKSVDEFVIVAAGDKQMVGTPVVETDYYETLPFSTQNESFIVETTQEGDRVWQTYRKVDTPETELFIFTEHDFGLIDSIMYSRLQQAYFGLTAIFIFLICLAAWVNRQTDWKQKHDQVARQMQERNLFSNMIAHEFRTPLTAIKGYASLLEENQAIQGEDRSFVTNIRSSAERLVLLVNDFLEVARLQAGKIKINPAETDLRSVLKRVKTDLEPLTTDKNLTLEYSPTKNPVLLKTDENRLIQVLTNIVTNSIKYTEAGKITLACEEKKGKVSVYVQDTGAGISAEDQKKIFKPFTRVGNSDDTTITGSGLGMWITQQLVELLGGEIGVESIENLGTRIIITFKD